MLCGFPDPSEIKNAVKENLKLTHTARRAILNKVNELRQQGQVTPAGNLRRSFRVKVTGLAFFDATHWSAQDTQRGHGHGTALVETLWELHPVWHVTIE